MSVRVLLDKPYAHFTNLDFISGRVVLTLTTETPVTTIVVKLEGESRTRLAGPKYPHGERPEKKRTEVEAHKLLYKVNTVFPSQELWEQSVSTIYYTLPPGTYEYPFKFKFPFNNDCANNHLATANLNMGSLRFEVARPSHDHVRKTLPPSISGFPGEAEIRYYVKATVVRPQFYKENYRSIADFKFLPIEPPRRKERDKETYARRQHQFMKVAPAPERKGLFRKSSSLSQIENGGEPPRYSVDVRLPSPPILTCNEHVPLRILITKQNENFEMVSVQVLQIELIGYTHIRAHDLNRTESGSWVILSRSNMGLPLGNGSEPVGHEWKLDTSMWSSLPLPDSVAPSFETCNLSRNYELEVRVGLSHGSSSGKPELMIIPLRLPVQVYSGIAPPEALLEAMGAKPTKSAEAAAPTPPPRPTIPDYAPPPNTEDYEEAPPSYEDAMAEALGPVDGPRREYNPPDTASRTSGWTGTDDKGPVENHGDDRLFPSNGAHSGSTDSLEVYCLASPVDGVISPESHDRPERSTSCTSSPIHPSGTLNPRPTAPPMRASPFSGVPARKPVPSQENRKPGS